MVRFFPEFSCNVTRLACREHNLDFEDFRPSGNVDVLVGGTKLEIHNPTF